MADRYWVGGTGTWDNTSTVNWSTTSGGSGGASVPIGNDRVIFDANSGSGTVTLNFSGAISIGGLNIGADSTLSFSVPSGPEEMIFSNDDEIIVKSSALSQINLKAYIHTNYTGAIDIDQPFFKTIRFGQSIQSFTSFSGSIEPVSTNIVAANTIIEFADFSTAVFDNATLTFRELSYNSVGSYGASTSRRTTFANNSVITATRNINFPSVSAVSGPSNFTINDSEINAPYMWDNGSVDIQSNATWKPTEFFLVPTANNVIVNSTPSSGIVRFANTTVNDSIVLTGTSSTNRLIVNTTTHGVSSSIWNFGDYKPRIALDKNNNTLTVTTSNTTFSNIDFWGVYDDSAGANTGITGTSIGVAQLSDGAAGETPRTLYFEGSDWDSSASWSLTSGGSTGETPPLPQDTVIIESNKTVSFSNTRMMPILETTSGAKLTINSTADVYYNGTTSSANTSIDSNAQYSFLLFNINGEWGIKDDNIFVISNGAESTFDEHNMTIVNRNTNFLDGEVYFQNLGSGNVIFDESSSTGSSLIVSLITQDSASTNFTIQGDRLVSLVANTFFTGFSSAGTNPALNNLLGTITVNSSIDPNSNICIIDGLDISQMTVDLISGELSVINGVQVGEFTRSNITTEATLSCSTSQNFTVSEWSAVGLSSVTPLYISGDVSYGGAGIVEASNLVVENSDATPADTWYAINSLDNGNNTGWIFQTTGNGLFWSNF